MAKEFDWTTNFVETFKDKLTIGYDVNLYYFSLALISFKKKDFNESLGLLSMVNYENVRDKVDVKCLLIQLYYELNSLENLLSQIDAFKHFIHNDRLLSRNVKDIHLNFVKLTVKLINIKYGKESGYDAVTLKKELNDTVVYDKGWLNQKIEELQVLLA